MEHGMKNEHFVSWRAPSNIALVKYWGKHGLQLPSNPSISFTLDHCQTITRMSWNEGTGKVRLIFNGGHNEKFAARAEKYKHRILEHMPFLSGLDLHIETENNFPHSAGIASSASAMSSLALCLCSLEEIITGEKAVESEFYRKASFLARLGSGSASRSVYGGYVSWGLSENIPGSSDEYATALPFKIHQEFADIRDTILIVSDGPKAVSSSEGHRLMETHPFAKQRFAQAHEHVASLLNILQNGDWEAFSELIENEALGLHGLMMSSSPGYILMKPGSLEIIDRVRRFRQRSGIPACFTLDAGPNIHLLYPAREAMTVNDFINEELLLYCKGKQRIDDRIGKGPQQSPSGE